MRTLLDDVLEQVRSGALSVAEAKARLAAFEDLGFAKVDHQRSKRQGFPEIVYGEGKTADHIISIACALQARGSSVLVTRVDKEKSRDGAAGVSGLHLSRDGKGFVLEKGTDAR